MTVHQSEVTLGPYPPLGPASKQSKVSCSRAHEASPSAESYPREHAKKSLPTRIVEFAHKECNRVTGNEYLQSCFFLNATYDNSA